MLKNSKFIVSLAVVIGFMMICQTVETKAAAGDYDASFGGGGIAEFQLNGLKSMNRIAIQKDGKILVAGYAPFGEIHRLVLRRHNSNGALDTSFGVNGEAVEQISASEYRYVYLSSPSEIALQPNGSILIGGRRVTGSTLDASVWRFTNTGFLDSAFDGDGRKDLSVSGSVMNIKMTTDGGNNPKILALVKDGEFSILARLNLTGSYDSEFGIAGKVKINGQYNDLATYKPALSLGESIYVAGAEDFVITARRYKTDGSLDTAFGNAGKITLPSYEIWQSFRKVVVQPDGKVLLSGTFENPAQRYRDFVVRVNAAGVFDQQFGTSTITGNIGAIFNPNAYDATNTDLELQSDGKIVVGRYTSAFSYKRYLPDGSEDTGYVQPSDGDFAFFTLQKNNRLVSVKEYAYSGGSYSGYRLRRLLAD